MSDLIARKVKVAGIVTDPPYASGASPAAVKRRTATTMNPSASRWIASDRLTPTSFEFLMDNVAHMTYELATDGACCSVFTDWRNMSLIVRLFEMRLWTPRTVVVWDKKTAGPGFFWKNQYELVVVLSKDKPRYPARRMISNLVRASKPSSGIHPNVKPSVLLRRLVEPAVEVKKQTGVDLVIDPFAGSAATGIAAVDSGLRFAGCEVDAHFFKIAVDSLRFFGKVTATP